MIKANKMIISFISTVLLTSVCIAEPMKTISSEEEVTSQVYKPMEEEIPINVQFVMELQKKLDKNDINGAINLFSSLPEELENDVELKSILASLYYSNKEFDNVISTCNKILSIDDKNKDAMELLYLCYKEKNNRKAYSELENKILDKDPYNPIVNIQKANDYVLSKKWSKAKDHYSKALRGDKYNLEAMFGYAKMSYYLDDLKTAVKYLNKIISIDPENAEALAYMGTIEFDKENFTTACEYIEKALKVNPGNYDYWLDYGTYLRYQGRYDEAIKAWNKAIEIDPDYFLAYENLAGIYDEQEVFDKALYNYKKVIEKNPEYFYAYETIAVLEYHAKNYKEAIKYFQQAYKYNQNYSYSLMTAACYFILKEPMQAKKILQAQMKKLDRTSVEYDLVRFFHDSYSRNAESTLLRKIDAVQSSNERGKMLFYMGLYNEIKGSDVIAKEFYSQVIEFKTPMFFEYRLAEWGLK